jgi:acyl-[acyl-carrier-protein]-phospholipid O-acyltransferase/long-chain-fatty-acid--[acyl-carrier-protein] ligase
MAGSQAGWKEGTVGRPVPGVRAKVTDLETGAELGPGKSGMLWISGPNVMKGYLGRDDLTAEVIQEGWYMTGDVALIDADGFIQITGRQSRFSKIGGEMVPHIAIEETLAKLVGGDDETGPKVVVTAVPDEKKGERLVVLHTGLAQSPEQVRKALADEGLPNLYIPSEDSFCQVDQIPILGSGKLDLTGLRQMALKLFGKGTE